MMSLFDKEDAEGDCMEKLLKAGHLHRSYTDDHLDLLYVYA